jgi:hypothetical protein
MGKTNLHHKSNSANDQSRNFSLKERILRMQSNYQAWYKGMNSSTFLKNNLLPATIPTTKKRPPTTHDGEVRSHATLVGAQVVSNETFTQRAYIVNNLTGAELIGECLGPVGCLSLDCGNQETVLFRG